MYVLLFIACSYTGIKAAKANSVSHLTLFIEDIPTFPMDTMYLQAIRKRVSVARRIEATLHNRKKVCEEHGGYSIKCAHCKYM